MYVSIQLVCTTMQSNVWTRKYITCMNSLWFSATFREVVREQYCIQRTVCERQANIAGVGRSTLRAYKMGIISHANGSDKSDQYENDTDQIWNIEATKPSQNIYLYIDTLDIEESADCTKDYLLIQDSPCSSTRRLCGSASDISYRSTTGQLQIKFSSDSDTSGRGYWGFYWLADRENLRPGRSTWNS